jgi:carnitine-CoA ligase
MMRDTQPLLSLIGRGEASIIDVWLARVAQTPDSTFLKFSGRQWTYGEAWDEILRYSAGLTRLGLRPGERVASYLSNSAETLWAWFGTLAAGGIYCPLNRAHKGTILREMNDRSGASIFITECSAATDMPAMPSSVRATVMVDDALFFNVDTAMFEPARPDPHDDALVIYTSGTTGSSKPVRLSHQLFAYQAGRVVESWGLTSEDVFHAWLPHFHIAGTLHQTMGTIVAGGTLALFSRFSASRFLDEAREVGATVVVGLPNVVNILWKSPPGPDDGNPIRLMLSVAVNADLHRGFEERFGLRMIEQYGMTEAELITNPHWQERYPTGSCGRPSPDWELIIADADDWPLASGHIGQILVRPRRPGILFSGYDGDEEATTAAFRNLWFHTGDFGRLDADGYLTFVDRGKHVIRRRSENISSIELERIVERFAPVYEAAAVGVPSPLGEEDVSLIVTLKAGASAGPADIHAYCVEAMAHFMVPRYIRIIDQFPRTEVGKIAKELLKDLAPGAWDAQRNGGV